MSLEKVERCPVCDSQSFQPFLQCRDYTTSGEVFHVEQCIQCGMLITNPRPASFAIGHYYESSQYISHQGTASGFLDSIYLIVRRFTLSWKYNIIKPYIHQQPILDIGCGTGAFLQYCQKNGAVVSGVEPNEGALKQAKALNLNVTNTLASFPDKKFSVITLWHVLEHIYDLPHTLTQLRSKLHDHGTIFIAVPNWQSPDARHYKSYWAAYDTPRHAWHFSTQSMTTLLQTHGFTLKKILPMKLDAYYVSILSEKYKAGGKLNMITMMKGLIRGYLSNRKARSNQNYSSLIYLVEK